jgi:DNA polymerase
MDNWDVLYDKAMSCTVCPLHEGRRQVVFGTGTRDAEVMFIGEGPGEQEDIQGEPFVGRAGQLLDTLLTSIGLERSKVYIANIVKCRPPRNRDPLPEEQEACIGYLRNQVYLIKPKIIVCLGRIAAMRIIKPEFKITAEHGKFFERGDYLLTAIYHPAALLRDPGKKPDTFEDLKKIEAAIKDRCDHTF